MEIFFGSSPPSKGTSSATERQAVRPQTQAAPVARKLTETSSDYNRTSGATRLASSSRSSLPSTDIFRFQSAAISPEDQYLVDRFFRSNAAYLKQWQMATPPKFGMYNPQHGRVSPDSMHVALSCLEQGCDATTVADYVNYRRTHDGQATLASLGQDYEHHRRTSYPAVANNAPGYTPDDIRWLRNQQASSSRPPQAPASQPFFQQNPTLNTGTTLPSATICGSHSEEMGGSSTTTSKTGDKYSHHQKDQINLPIHFTLLDLKNETERLRAHYFEKTSGDLPPNLAQKLLEQYGNLPSDGRKSPYFEAVLEQIIKTGAGKALHERQGSSRGGLHARRLEPNPHHMIKAQQVAVQRHPSILSNSKEKEQLQSTLPYSETFAGKQSIPEASGQKLNQIFNILLGNTEEANLQNPNKLYVVINSERNVDRHYPPGHSRREPNPEVEITLLDEDLMTLESVFLPKESVPKYLHVNTVKDRSRAIADIHNGAAHVFGDAATDNKTAKELLLHWFTTS